MLFLGIESSCDETAAAVVRNGRDVLSSVIHSQIASHRPYGGVVPELASREHVGRFPLVVAEAIRRAGVGWDEIDALAVTHGPGLISSLLIGLTGARALGQAIGKPVWGVHHLEAHMAAIFLDAAAVLPSQDAPLLVLLVSGGHSGLIDMRGVGEYRWLGQTLDDAAGECLDKGATLLGLGYPGGPAIECAARGGAAAYVKFPRGLEHARNRLTDNGWDIGLCLSFSGLKTALL
ncbi:MAG: tRNA (adenosine(37)-N6)-threonylcarbamoyltransferase complex transferase subunit TsaD, partial [Verrucomicrobiota bacterium]|nr:tRNA (adenosine(37)-N6)-threonylcarbamoyltransferase complex transferase subunit TsaD [Verrucomicrobiota bacterium]